MRFFFAWIMLLLAGCALDQPPPPTRLSPISPVSISPVPTRALPQETRSLRSVAQIVTMTFTPDSDQPAISFATNTPVPTATPAGIQIEVAAGRSGVQLRALPDAASEMLGALDEYTPLTILGRTSDNVWLRVATPDGEIGWVMLYFLDVEIDLNSLDIPVDVVVPERPTATQPAPTAVPPFDPRQHITHITPNVRQIFAAGQQQGNRANVFSKVGDSITVGTYFLYPIGWGAYNLRDYGHLNATIATFSGAVARDGNSFANNSLAADNGWTSNHILNPALAHPDLCNPGETPLACEYRVVRPAIALIMIGTNDVAEVPAGTFSANVNQIVEISLANGVIPALSTIPSRAGMEANVATFNQTIRNIASHHGIPLWDYGTVMAQLPNGGLSTDGVHPSWPPGDFAAAADFTRANLDYGYTLRNLMALQTLDAIWRAASG